MDVAAVHIPLDTVHKKEFVPLLNPVTAEEGFVMAVTLEVPVNTDQAPVPAVGLVADKVALEEQSV